MERLNNIIGRATQRRPQESEQRSAQGNAAHPHVAPTQGQRPAQQGQTTQQPSLGQQGQPMPTHHPARPLPEQTARIGQSGQKSSFAHGATTTSQQYTQQAPAGKTRYTPEEPYYAAAPSAPPSSATRPFYQRPQQRQQHAPTNVQTQTPYPQRQPTEREGLQGRSAYPAHERTGQTSQIGQLPPRNEYHYTDEYVPALRSDVLETDEDEEVGMQYGDWEEESSDITIYQHANNTSYEAPAKSSYAQPYQVEADLRTRPTRNLHDMPNTYTPQTPPMPVTRVQEMPQYPRKTQPLSSQSIAEISQGREREVPQIIHPINATRQVAKRASLTPMPATPVAPPAPKRTMCPKCKGAGYLRANVTFGHPNFGKPIACECKEAEKREKRRQQLIELSDLNAFRNQSFHNFSTTSPGIHPSVAEAYQEAYSFAQNPNGWLVLIGPNGCGKTHLAAAIANQSLNEGAVVLFSVVPELLDHLRGAFAPTATDIYDQLFSKMREAGLLVLDDLGAHYSTPWATEKLYQLLNYRYSWRMPTVITTNNLGLQAVDARLRSRMMDSSLVVTVNLERARDCRPYLPRRGGQ